MRVTKLEAADLQLKQAIRLFFSRGDPVSVHTLAAAASQIFYDIAKKHCVEGLVRGNPLVRDDKRKQWIGIVNEPQNFFKHADRDPDGVYEWDPELTQVLMFEAAIYSMNLIENPSIEAQIFNVWFLFKHPGLLKQGALRDLMDSHHVSANTLGDYEGILRLINEA